MQKLEHLAAEPDHSPGTSADRITMDQIIAAE